MPEKKIGIFDKEGKNNNPLTGKPFSSNYQFFSNIVHEQPLIRDIHHSYEILDKLRNNQVLVIESATGTGKTVVLPKLASHLVDYKKRVVVTVPKQSLAANSGGFCAKCMDVRLGEEVGFAHRDSKIVEKIMEDDEEITIERSSFNEKNTKILFVTDGWLSSKVSKDLTLSDYGVIMIDEVHERNKDIDQLLLYLREALILNDQLKVIITSATFDVKHFANYFSSKGISVATKSVSGEPNFPIKPIFLDKKINGMNIGKECFETYKKYLYDKNIKEDCIIFVNSNGNAEKICKELAKLDKRIYCIEVTSTTNSRDDKLENKAAEDPKTDPYLKELYEKKRYDRRVIVATEVWESSVTLPLLKYVIEPGIALVSNYDGEKMLYSLLNSKIARGQVLQRKGRVGRTTPGTCIFLYTEKTYNNLPPSKIPGILKEDFSTYLLKWWIRDENETLGDVISFTMNLMDQPSKGNIKTALKSLYALDFCTGDSKRDDQLTELGYFLAQQQYEVDGNIKYTKALYYASWYGCKDEVAVILSIFSLKKGIADLFLECKNAKFSDKEKKECDRKLSRFQNNFGDMIAGYKAFLAYIEEECNQKGYRGDVQMERWCKKNYLNIRQLEKVKENYFTLVKKKYPFVLFEENNEEKFKFDSLDEKISYCLLKGFFINLAEKKGKQYVNLFPPVKTKADINDIIKLSSKKTKNFMKKEMKYIIYNKLQEFDTGKNFTDTLGIPEHILNLLTDFEKEMIGLK